LTPEESCDGVREREKLTASASIRPDLITANLVKQFVGITVGIAKNGTIKYAAQSIG
jgi:hypothetical protein